MAQTRRRSSSGSRPRLPIMLQEVLPAPVVLFRGPERTLADRAIKHLRKSALKADPNLEVVEADAQTCTAEQLALWVSPSLFGERRLIVLTGVDEAAAELADELVDQIRLGSPDVQLLLYHRGGNAMKRVTDAVRQAGYPIWDAQELKWESQRLSLVRDEAVREGGKLLGESAQMLVDGSGTDLDELLGVTRRLLGDTGGQVTPESVRDHFAGQVETDSFQVADAMAKGEGPRAVILARRALESGVEPVLIIAALAYKLRTVAKVTAPGVADRQLGMSPQVLSHARSDARRWTPDALGRAICLVAKADADVKGASKDPKGAVERCLIEISRARA